MRLAFFNILLLFLQPKLQWSPFKQYYQLNEIGTRLDHSVIKSLIDGAFPDQEHEKEIDCKKLPLQDSTDVSVPCLASVVCKPCAFQHEHEDDIAGHTTSECTSRHCAKGEVVCTWQALRHSFFQKKSIVLGAVKWRRNFFDLFSLRIDPLDTTEKGEARLATSKKCSVLDVLEDQSKKIHNKPDPIYSSFGKLRNGFYVSSNGLVFSSEIEVHALGRSNFAYICVTCTKYIFDILKHAFVHITVSMFKLIANR